MARLLFLTLASIFAHTVTAQVLHAHVDPTKTYGIWKGWGTSLCWWANGYGARPDLISAIFSPATTTITDAQLTVPGLSLNIARYNAGGSSWNTVNGSRMVVSPNIPHWKQIEGYWLDGASTDPSSPSWNWTADPRQRAVVQAAKQMIEASGRPAVFEIFSNSPMWWMLGNHNPSGNANNDNLLPKYFQYHAIYMATIAAYAAKNWNISFGTVEAFNEPSGSWGAQGTQEGCHVSHGAQAAVLTYLRPAMDAVGLQNTPIAASDESRVDQAISTWNALNATVRALFPEFNVHGYEGASSDRAGLYTAVVTQGGKFIRNSEFGDGDGTGAGLATNLHLDFSRLHVTSWVYWQAIDESGGWGPLDGDIMNARITAVTTKWYIMAQYTRHIRPGHVILSIGGGNTDAAAIDRVIATYDQARNMVVVVTWNPTSSTNQFDIDLSAFTTVTGPVTRWRTDAVNSNGERYVQYNDTVIANKAFTAIVASTSVQTFEISGVQL